MTQKKQRLTVTVDPELVEEGQRAVASGQAESVSGWVSAALEDKIRRDRKLELLAAAVADYEREFGEITEGEIVAQQRADREDAVVVRGGSRRRPEAKPA
jgi:metal-responsive CopG/Arc/MetJ family transcriptional regulator